MTAILITLAILACLALLTFLLAPMGRWQHPGLSALRGWNYAHRGLHDGQTPENSMAAFQAALGRGYGIELDVHLLRDGNLAVIHDSSLKRTTGQEGRIEDLTTQDLSRYTLEGTQETVPTFRQLLDLYAGKAPLIVELKPVDNNHAALAKAACDMLEGYEGPWCMESFDPRVVYWLKKNRPQVIRGQLTEDYFTGKGKLPWVLKFLLKHNLLNFVTRPDFVAYKFTHRKHTPTYWVWKKFWSIQGVAWTLKTKEEYDEAVAEGLLPIFENFIP